jgi:hypothetical protein
MEIRRDELFDGAFIKPGHKMTFEGIYRMVPNPSRRWWQFWRPRFVATDELQTFTVV